MSRLYLRGITGGRSGWIAISWGLVFAVFFILPVIDLYAPGRVLWWHIRERAYVQGGIEVVVLYSLRYSLWGGRVFARQRFSVWDCLLSI